MMRRGIMLALVGASTSCFSTVRVEAPNAVEVKKGEFPHHLLTEVLAEHVDEQGLVDYRALRADRSTLERYLGAGAAYSPDSAPELFSTESDRLAYWLNAYNANVLYAVTLRPELRSVGDAKADFFYFTRYVLGGDATSLYDLENDIVRERFDEPRIHFALNCASLGCPDLPQEAFVPERLEAQLARETREFCADERNVAVRSDGRVRLSKIFDWYEEDFEAAGGPVALCRRWGREELPEDKELEFVPYDWTLNAQARTKHEG